MSGFDFGDSEQLGADGKIGGAKRDSVNSQTDTVLLGDERNHSSAIEKIFGLTHRKHAFPGYCVQDWIETTGVGLADKQQMTTLNISGGTEVIDSDRPVVIFLALDRFIEQRTKRVLTSDADDERFIRRGEGRIRPVNESAEIVEKAGFERVFTLRWRGRPDGAEEQP